MAGRCRIVGRRAGDRVCVGQRLARRGPMTVARLDGVYDVVKKVVAQKNFTDIKVGDSFTRTYDVTLDCDTGPCGGTVKIDAEESKQIQTQKVTWTTRLIRTVRRPVAR
jgi:hypothetical protein